MTDTKTSDERKDPTEGVDNGEHGPAHNWEWLVALFLVVAIVGALGFIATYLAQRLGAEFAFWNQMYGLSLCLIGAGLGGAFILWAKLLLPHDEATDYHHDSTDEERIEAAEAIESTQETLVSRRLIVGLLSLAGGLFGAALIFPLRSFGPSPNNGEVTSTPWRRGLKVVDSTAFSLCMDNGMPMVVFGMEPAGNITKALKGDRLGTLVTA